MLLFDEEFNPGDNSELAKAAKDIRISLGSHVSLVIGYGSWVYGTQKPDSMKDFLVIVDDLGEFYKENDWLAKTPGFKPVRFVRIQTLLNRVSPNFYHLYRGKVKIGVVSQTQFMNEPDSFSKYIGFRLTKPLAIFQIPGSTLSQDDVVSVISDLREDNLRRTLYLLPEKFTLEDFALKYLGLSYEADVRFEDPTKIRTTYEANKSMLDEMFKEFLSNMEYYGNISVQGSVYSNHVPASDHYRERASMILRKPLFLAQNFLNFFTAADPIGYTMRKVRLGFKK